MNHIVIMGRLTRDPELRHTQSNTAVASFTLAVDRGYASKDSGDRQTDFIDVVAWRGTGEFVSKYFTKGQMCAVSGRLQIRDWQDKDGNKRRSAEVVADNVYFTESKRSRDGGGGGFAEPRSDYNQGSSNQGYNNKSYNTGYSAPVTGSDFSELDDDDGDLPF